MSRDPQTPHEQFAAYLRSLAADPIPEKQILPSDDPEKSDLLEEFRKKCDALFDPSD